MHRAKFLAIVLIYTLPTIIPCGTWNPLDGFVFIQRLLYNSKVDSAEVDDSVVFKCRTRADSSPFKVTRTSKSAIRRMNPRRPLAFILHGWKDEGTSDWMFEAQANWIKYKDINVCIMDWSSKAMTSQYQDAVLQIFNIGATLANMVEVFESYGFSRRKTTFVGYSLGAHAVGFAGQILKGQVQEIIGLDPAGPLFTMPFDVGPKYRLDPTDAEFVQVIHTSGGTFGTHVKSGHADFYPNGGAPPQTNCLFNTDTEGAAKARSFRDSAGCSHSVVVEYFNLSMNPQLQFVGLKCPSYKFFVLGLCRDNRKCRFGIHCDHFEGDYYFTTEGSAPFVEKRKRGKDSIVLPQGDLLE